MALTLSTEQLLEIQEQLVTAVNGKVIDSVNELARVVVAHADDNPMMNTLVESCKKIQSNYNDNYKPSIDKLVSTYIDVADLTEALKKKQAEMEVQQKDTSFQFSGIDTSAVL
ncbi:hypothetical protein [Acetivibrio ethanolgignens]|uniref:Uncharacterized protein n=1 Tax=Acetivibrio ethanolgignens TaxID=290052 RepID=A0A0V8QCK2_9FIRM|nr:hypothetical protein [Acetivibrio ethanolgignens]KSV58274.1 hypothetical protein ASU35_13505 [Acetivibrio ethanolgignens]